MVGVKATISMITQNINGLIQLKEIIRRKEKAIYTDATLNIKTNVIEVK